MSLSNQSNTALSSLNESRTTFYSIKQLLIILSKRMNFLKKISNFFKNFLVLFVFFMFFVSGLPQRDLREIVRQQNWLRTRKFKSIHPHKEKHISIDHRTFTCAIIQGTISRIGDNSFSSQQQQQRKIFHFPFRINSTREFMIRWIIRWPFSAIRFKQRAKTKKKKIPRNCFVD